VRALGIDTATAIASVGLVTSDVTVERARPMASSHARTLLPAIDEVLAAAGIGLEAVDLFAVSVGPGSFTGLRIGLAVVKGLALATGKPAVGVPTLHAYALAVGPRPGMVWPVLDARKGEVYAAGYRWRGADLDEVVPPSALAPSTLAERLRPPCTLVGDGVDTYGEHWSSVAGLSQLRLADRPPSGAVVARLGTTLLGAAGAADLAALEPRYCRLSEAELHRASAVAAPVSTE
jgi:tRNA threonylcarbamoyladenosine biosynthesis protein TsaB